jgi:hypothetical protein
MTAPLDEKGLPPAYGGCTCSCHRVPGIMHIAACCHPGPGDFFDLPATALPDGMEVNGRDIYECANQLMGYVGPDTEDGLAQFLMREGKAAADLADELVQAQSALAAMRAERDEAWNNGYAARDGVVDACRSQVLRLTEKNEGLERHNQALLDKVSSEDCACAYDGPDDVCLGHSPKLKAAEARIKALEDEKAKALALLDHLVGWIVHDCGAEVPFSGEQDETYATLNSKENKD